MKVLLLAGGWSPEREVSLKGGEQIAAALKERGHSVTLCDPAKDFERLMDMAREHDAAFINLHGAPGEDGLVQAILDRVNCPYQGAGPAGSFLALHKAAARQIFRDAGLNIPDGVFLPRHPGPNWKPDLQYPMFVKSNTGGSSLHLSRVTNEEELYTALNSLFSMGEEAIVETAVVGREVTCGVLGEEALAPILVVSKGNYFDYHNKYAPDGAQEICPAPIAPEETAKVQDAALRAHHALGLKGYSRADFILQDDGHTVLLGVLELGPGEVAGFFLTRRFLPASKAPVQVQAAEVQALQLTLQQVQVPARQLIRLIVQKPVFPLLILRQPGLDDDLGLFPLQPLQSPIPGVSGQDDAVLVDDDGGDVGALLDALHHRRHGGLILPRVPLVWMDFCQLLCHQLHIHFR